MHTCEKCKKVYADTFSHCPHCRSERAFVGLVVVAILGSLVLFFMTFNEKRTVQPVSQNAEAATIGQNRSSETGSTHPPDPQRSELSTLIPSCSPQGGPPCESDIYQKVWLRLESEIGEVTKVDTKSIRHLDSGAAAVLVYTYIPNSRYDPSRMRQLFFDCAGHYQDITQGDPTVMDAPPRSVVGLVSTVACAGAKDARVQDVQQ